MRKVGYFDLIAQHEEYDKEEGPIAVEQTPECHVHDQLKEHVRRRDQFKVTASGHQMFLCDNFASLWTLSQIDQDQIGDELIRPGV